MKCSIALLAAGASVVVAQSLNDLPPCGQTCISNMLGLGPSFGCSAGDTVCYCTEPNFGFGVRDCANEACGAGQAAAVISYGEAYCKALLASASVTGGSALTILSSAASAASSAATDVSASTTGGAAPSAITTVPLVATVSGNPVTTGFSTVFSTPGASGASGSLSSALSGASGSLSSALSGASSAASSAAASASSGASSVASSLASGASSAASSAASAASSAASAASSAAASATSTGGAPAMTAGSILGAAGMAALLFI